MKSPAGGMKSRQEFTVNVGKEDMRILALMMLMVVGCGSERKLTAEEEKVVGTYEVKILDYFKWVVLANGIAEAYTNGKNDEHEYKWKVANGELHTVSEDGRTDILRINKDGSITSVALIDIVF